MNRSMKIGAAVMVVVGLVIGGSAVAGAVDDPGEDGGIRTEQLIREALAPLVADETLTSEQADAVVGELAPRVARARYQDQTRELVSRSRRLAAETAEVLGITPAELGAMLQSGMTLAEIAAVNDSSGDQLVERVTNHLSAHLAVRVTAGRLDQARADEIVARIGKALADLVDVEHPFRAMLNERRSRTVRAAALNAAADALGMPIDDIRTQLEAGISLAQIAAEQGVGEQELIDALASPFVAWIDQAVEGGRLTTEQAAEATERAERRAQEAISRIPGT